MLIVSTRRRTHGHVHACLIAGAVAEHVQHDEVNGRNQIRRRHSNLTEARPEFTYDQAGNLTYDGEFHYRWDAWNRLTKISKDHDGNPGTPLQAVGQYGYDPLGRRIWKHVTNSGSLNTLGSGDLHYYDGDRLIEVRVAVLEGPPAKTIETVADVGIDAAVALPTTDDQLRLLSKKANKTAAEMRDDWSPSELEAQGIETEVSDVPIEGKAQRLAAAGTIVYETYREFVWALDYIDEQVASYSPSAFGEFINYVLQDANYNIVGLIYSYYLGEGLQHQFRYTPYGEWLAYEDGAGAGPGHPDPEKNGPRAWIVHGHQGLMYDQESGLIYNRGRYLHPELGRFLSADPNGQGLQLSSAVLRNAQTPVAMAALSAMSQYIDGLSIYQPYGSNPMNAVDPTGQFAILDLGGTNGIQGDMISNYADTSFSVVDAMKGIALLQQERHAMLDDVIGAASESFDSSAIDTAMSIYNGYQAVQLGVFFGGAGSKLVGGAIGAGKRAFGYFANRAGSRRSLINVLNSGTDSMRQLFRFGGVGPGQWVRKSRGGQMDAAARAYQRQITGRVDEEYLVNGVHFDGFRSGTLIEARDWQEARQFVQADGQFIDWFGKSQVARAGRQIEAAGRHPLQWAIADEAVAKAFRKLFEHNGVKIDVLWVPRAP